MNSGYLLDTSAFIWWLSDHRRLSVDARRLILDGANPVWLSAASIWEMAIKVSLGKLRVPGNLDDLVETQTRANGLQVLDIRARHASATMSLPPIHNDPFDRMLIAQAQSENLVLLTPDSLIAQYPGVRVVW
ncbi:MAG TPA: type II toxin-antitoxin system VapC family toxin [Thermoflexales bacterium]|nr:type II toxin-antitoxin system VapC family toxin [Thermoflexales bacterium]HQX11797.1 type II toxin-antitoxin system VapC family toxin [Thermoflexales bacterium]HQY25838.1 type II toxin-antitoxin system VapC family toxin [Thermoflexales bacterium]HQZ53424.1 type II toxin-antitoxin system VapC family toxin [Thermoflexales bacterium]